VKVLIAEDDLSTADLYEVVLRGRGHSVTIANLGEECLHIYSEQMALAKSDKSTHDDVLPYDSVIIDYKLPDINGLDVAKKILMINPHQRIIFLTAYASEILAQGSDNSMIPIEVLAKPISNKALTDTVEDVASFNDLKNHDLSIPPFRNGLCGLEQLGGLVDLKKGRNSGTV
jgi:CheY-like chemotaxis protein